MQSAPELAFAPGRRVHCLGIGGIGVSAVAQWLRYRGVRVTGSDRAASDVVSDLQPRGIAVAIEPDGASMPPDVDAVVASDAVPPTDPARAEAEKRGIPTLSYAQALGVLTRASQTVAISGSHGKSTTTALVALLLEAGGLDPTVVVGTRVPAFGNSNFRSGSSDITVVEADEYRGHCLELSPAITVITNVDHDHVDAFPTKEAYAAVFHDLIARTAAEGRVVLRASDPATPALRRTCAGRAVATFDLVEHEPQADFAAANVTLKDGLQRFDVLRHGDLIGAFRVPFPGAHVVLNVLAALAAVARWDLPLSVLQETIAEFCGTWRRFELVGTFRGVPVISDYAHHPTELRALLNAARAWYPDRRIILAFQSHQRARARAFARQFLDVLRLPPQDLLVLAEVYDVAGREDPRTVVSTATWAETLRGQGSDAVYAPTLDAVEAALVARVRGGDVVLVAGAGSIDRVARRIVASQQPGANPTPPRLRRAGSQ